jgi:hypothetical protein
MEKNVAQSKADTILSLMLQHQPNLFGHQTYIGLLDEERAKQAAKSVAAFRAELIAQLEKQ